MALTHIPGILFRLRLLFSLWLPRWTHFSHVGRRYRLQRRYYCLPRTRMNK